MNKAGICYLCFYHITLICYVSCYSGCEKGNGKCKKTKQSSCNYVHGPSKHCIDYVKTLNTDKDKQAVLDRINIRRNKVAAGEIKSLPPAVNMVKLIWDNDLEYSAQRWADQCIKYNKGQNIRDTCIDSAGENIGQNIATLYGESPGLAPSSLVDVWYMELLNINSSVITHYRPSNPIYYDYFTQMVWAETFKVGCGGVQFKEQIKLLDKEQYRTVNRLICNFSPSGNRVGDAVYIRGKSCSLCPNNGMCDTNYKALCNSYLPNTIEYDVNVTETLMSSNQMNLSISNFSLPQYVNENTLQISISTTSENTEHYIPFEFFSNNNPYTIPPLSVPTEQRNCKDVMVVDDFIELLKKKISKDPLLKDIINTDKMSSKNVENEATFTDSSVAQFVSHLYSKQIFTTTTNVPVSDSLNSTLLVDLIEAVIFRNSAKNIFHEEKQQEDLSAVNPVKIQAELSEVKQNADFTGHYFFPEDDDEKEQTASETTDSYYDDSNFPASDVVLELEELKQKKTTRDFIDEILDSDSIFETTVNTNT